MYYFLGLALCSGEGMCRVRLKWLRPRERRLNRRRPKSVVWAFTRMPAHASGARTTVKFTVSPSPPDNPHEAPRTVRVRGRVPSLSASSREHDLERKAQSDWPQPRSRRRRELLVHGSHRSARLLLSNCDGASGSFQRYRRAESTGQPPSRGCDGDGGSNDGVVLT